MRGGDGIRASVAVALVGVMVACTSPRWQSPTPETLCYPRQCSLDVQNDEAQRVGVAYYDSTGVGETLGSVDAGKVRRFSLSRRTSRTVTVEILSDREVYRARLTLSQAPFANVMHFPADFEAAPVR
jgi:hypothetical protein